MKWFTEKKIADHLTDRVFFEKFETLFETSRLRELSKAELTLTRSVFVFTFRIANIRLL